MPFLPLHRYGSEGHAWGDYVWAKENVAAALRASLLRSLGPGGDRRYRAAAFDHRPNAAI